MSNYHGGKQDLRVTRTHLSLRKALLSLLEQKPFSKITVNDICEEALTSRATFYSHFEDKYDLLKLVLSDMKAEIEQSGEAEAIAAMVKHVYQHPKFYKHLLPGDGGQDLASLLRSMIAVDYIEKIQDLGITSSGAFSTDLVTQFTVGGTLEVVSWLVSNNFPVPEEMVIAFILGLRRLVMDYRPS